MHFPCLQHGENELIFNYTFLILHFSSLFINEAEELGLRVQGSDGATRDVFCFISLHSPVSPPWDTLPSGATINGCAGCALQKGIGKEVSGGKNCVCMLCSLRSCSGLEEEVTSSNSYNGLM